MVSGGPSVRASSRVAVENWRFLWKAQTGDVSKFAQCWEVILGGERAGRVSANGGSTLTKLLCRGRMDDNWKILSSFREARVHIDYCGVNDTFPPLCLTLYIRDK